MLVPGHSHVKARFPAREDARSDRRLSLLVGESEVRRVELVDRHRLSTATLVWLSSADHSLARVARLVLVLPLLLSSPAAGPEQPSSAERASS